MNGGYWYLSLVVCILGGLVYCFTDGAKHAEVKNMGNIAFSWGLLVFLFCVGCHGVNLFPSVR